MATKKKLYTVNEWNKIQFGNAFALGGSTGIWDKLIRKEYGDDYTAAQANDYMYGTTSAQGNNSWLNISKASNPFSKANIGSTLSSVATAASPVISSLISDGYSTGGVGEGISGIGNAVGSAVGGPWGAVISAGSGLIGGLTNRAFGTKNNDKNINTINQNAALAQSAGTAMSGATTTNDLLNSAQYMTGGTGFGTKDLVKGGWFSKSKAKKKGQKYLDTEAAAFSFQNNALQAGASNVDRNIDNTALTSFAAFGGLLDYPNTFADGGIHIKHPGRLTALKERTGKTEAELYNDGNPAHKKMVVFARNARKWNHGLGGVLNMTNPWGNNIGSLNLMQNNDYIDAINNRTNAMYNSKNGMSITGAMNAFGGELGTNGTDWTNGLTFIDEGKTHEENPYGGVQVGVDPEGTPNLVEEGETIYNDYVFSDRMKVPEFMYSQLGIKGAPKDGISYAKASKKLAKESEERPNDPISLDGLDAAMSKLAMVQETERLKKQIEEQNQFAYGGKKGNMFVGEGGKPNRLQKLRDSYTGAQFPTLQDAENIYEYNHRFNPWYLGLDVKMEDVPSGLTGYTRRRPVIRAEQPNYIMPATGPSLQEMEGIPVQNIKRDYPLGVAMPFVPKVNNTTSNNTSVQSPQQGANTVQDIPEEDIVQWYEDQGLTREAAQEAATRDLSLNPVKKAQSNQATGRGTSGGTSSKSQAARSSSTQGTTQTDTKGIRSREVWVDGERHRVPVLSNPDEYIANHTLADMFVRPSAIPGTELNLNIPTKDIQLRTNDTTTTGAGQGENNTLPHYATWMRYAPAVGAGIMTLTDLLGLTNRPDYTSAEKLEAAANAMAQSGTVSYDNPLGNYIQYRPMDITYGLNQLAAQSRATDRAIQNTAGTRGAATNAMIANGYNNQLAQGNLYRQALEYNDALQKQVEEFNRGTDQFNAQMGLEAALANARYRQAGLQARLSGLAQAAAIRDSIDQRVGAARSANITNLLNSLGNIGRENFAFNQINSTAAANNGYGYGNRGGDVTHSNTGAKGGKLRKKNKK